eukprot:4591867-Pleurochrysis_carterae.AAC.1
MARTSGMKLNDYDLRRCSESRRLAIRNLLRPRSEQKFGQPLAAQLCNCRICASEAYMQILMPKQTRSAPVHVGPHIPIRRHLSRQRRHQPQELECSLAGDGHDDVLKR